MEKKEIVIFNSEEFGGIRTIGTSEEPLFCLVDVCRALDLTPSKISQRLEKGVLSKYTLPTEGGPQEVNFINEDGLYDVIFDSRKPEAKKFRKWVTSEVLPSIRKTGAYTASSVVRGSSMDDYDALDYMTAAEELPPSLSDKEYYDIIMGLDGFISLARRYRLLMKKMDSMQNLLERYFNKNVKLAAEVRELKAKVQILKK